MEAEDIGHHQLIVFLLFAIAFFLLSAIILFNITLQHRKRKINLRKEKNRLQSIIQTYLFEFIFDQSSLEKTVELLQPYQTSDMHKGLLIKSLIGLYQSYSGTVQNKLQECFKATQLADYSLTKLSHKKWEYRVEGLRDLSDMHVKTALKDIEKCLMDKYVEVQKEALIALVKLGGIEQIPASLSKDLYIDKWTQATILYTIKRQNIAAPTNWKTLVNTENDSFIALVMQLMSYFYVDPRTYFLGARIQKITAEELRLELQEMLSQMIAMY